MKIFKQLSLDQFLTELKSDDSERDVLEDNPKNVAFGEAFVINSKGSGYPEHIKFLVYIRERFLSNDLEEKSSWHFISSFSNLKTAVSYANFLETNTHEYEYYFQHHNKELKEGGKGVNPDVDVMGDLGWELCAVQGTLFIYKRVKIY